MSTNHANESFPFRQKYFKTLDIVEITLIALLLILVSSLLVNDKAFAMDESGKVKWQLLYISADHGCANYQYIMADTYDELAKKYFDLYKFANSNYPPQCISDKKYANYTLPSNVDLLILVYDDQIANRELHPNDVGGFYTHIGHDRTKNHTIVICDCSNFEFAAPTWTLSHELSHFITYYLGFGLEVQNQIHTLAAKYDECVEVHWDNSTCSKIENFVYGDHYFTSVPVMTPYQPAVGISLILVKNNTSTTSNDPASSELVMDMQKEITKWWLAGTINDTEYSKILDYLVTKPSASTNINLLPDSIILASGRDGEEENSTYYDLSAGKNQKTSVLLERVPFKLENNTSLSGNSTLPQWFKMRAHEWLYNKTFDNEDYINGIKYLFGLTAGR